MNQNKFAYSVSSTLLSCGYKTHRKLILSIHHSTQIYWHYGYVIIMIIIILVLNYTKLDITNNNYTYTVIYQSHCNVIIH